MNPCIAMDYIENCLKIKTKSGTVVPFRLNDAQRKLYAVAKRQQDAGKPVRLIILKARQLGFSTLTEGLIFHACATRKNVNALIVAHREDATANLFRMSKLFYDELPAPVLRTDVLSMEDLKPGMELTGTVRNVIDFGAFVDIGVHQDGLVHISQMTKRFIKHPLEAVSVGDIVEVKVISLDLAKKRIGLSMLLDK